MMSVVSLLFLAVHFLVPRIHDGDTFYDASGKGWRLWGADALELRQWCNGRACGENARDALVELIGGREVTCERRGKSYDRTVGQCFVDGMDLGREMVRAGWAFDEPDYSNGLYSYDETLARDRRRGMWSYTGVMRPSEWRRTHP
jgi:endonuclease YncB( thermonuclease family)